MSRFLQYIFVGLVLSAPFGPVATLVVRRGLGNKFVLALVTGLGATIADATYSSIALLATGFVTDAIIRYRAIIYFGGGAVLLACAYTSGRTLRPQATSLTAGIKDGVSRLGEGIVQGCAIALMNPVNFLGVTLTVLSLVPADTSRHVIVAVTGIALGSALWWLALTLLLSRLRKSTSARTMWMINAVAAATLFICGLGALIRAATSLSIK